MPHALFHFHGELNDFLPPDQRNPPVQRSFTLRASVKDTIEAIGVPHPEIDALVANGILIDFAYIVQPDDEIHVYPAHQAPPRSLPLRAPLTQSRFVLDVHLGRLRMLGFDTLWQRDLHDPELAAISSQESRILLTRDRGLLKRSEVIYGYYVRATSPRSQAAEVGRRFGLANQRRPFSLCLRCNTALQPVDKAIVLDRLPPATAEHFHQFKECPRCKRIYWEGSHHDRMRRLISEVTGS